jgi:putative transposase
MNSDRIFFVTAVTVERLPIFRRETTARLLIEALALYREQGKFLLHEFVVMPDHIHLLLTPSDSISLERAMQFIKGGFSYRLDKRGSVWQASFTNHRIRDWGDYVRCREYIRMNPVRAVLAARPEEYAYSSAGGAMPVDAVPEGLKPSDVGRATWR